MEKVLLFLVLVFSHISLVGGVGKSTFSTQLSFAFADGEDEVGLMDIDICGPSIPRMMGLLGRDIHRDGSGWQPVYVSGNLGVMSVGFMLENEDTAVIWRGPKKNGLTLICYLNVLSLLFICQGLIKQFLRDVEWGDLDYLVIDTPPGTSDEHLSIAQYLKGCKLDGAVIVTTPQEVALLDVRKEINFCRKLKIPIIGVVENMAGFVCPNCKNESVIFKPSTGGAKGMCEEMNVPFLGSVPIDPRLARSCDEGKNFLEAFEDSPTSKNIMEIVSKVRSFCEKNEK